jgi:hypothetical protein
MEVKKEILRSLGRFAMQSMTHRHVFVTPSFKSFATTRGIGPFHGHRIFVEKKWIETDVARSGTDHRHKVIINGKELISGLPVEGPSTELF